jgi:hypothetical protein
VAGVAADGIPSPAAAGLLNNSAAHTNHAAQAEANFIALSTLFMGKRAFKKLLFKIKYLHYVTASGHGPPR